MAISVGKDGYLGLNTTKVAYIDSWTLNTEIGTADITAYGNTSKVIDSTLRSWSGTFTGTLDRSDTDQAELLDQQSTGTLADKAIRLAIFTATYWSGNVRVSGININSQVGDKVSITGNFVGNGALAYTAT